MRMPSHASLIGFALVSLGMVLTPGPNMIYLISRSITQGPAAGIVSLGGVALGFVFYMLCAAFGITALLFAVPYAYDALRFAGAAYLLWLAWQALALGAIQIVISVSVNAMIALAAGSIARFLGTRPSWLLVQRWLMGTVLAGLAVKMALEARRA